jgi:hypothetical protein
MTNLCDILQSSLAATLTNIGPFGPCSRRKASVLQPRRAGTKGALLFGIGFVVANASEVRASQQTTGVQASGSNCPVMLELPAREGPITHEPCEPGRWRPEPPQSRFLTVRARQRGPVCFVVRGHGLGAPRAALGSWGKASLGRGWARTATAIRRSPANPMAASTHHKTHRGYGPVWAAPKKHRSANSEGAMRSWCNSKAMRGGLIPGPRGRLEASSQDTATCGARLIFYPVGVGGGLAAEIVNALR